MYFVKRTLRALPVLLAVSFIVFVSVRLVPGDPARVIAGPDASDELLADIRADLGLDRPVISQYITYLANVLRGNLGKSYYYNTPVTKEVMSRFPATAYLALAGFAFSVVLGVGLGAVSAIMRGTPLDRGALIVATAGISLPSFWISLLMIILFAVQLKWLPAGGYGTWRHAVLPALTLGLFGAGTIARLARSSILEVLQLDFVRTAKAKGLAPRAVFWKHVVRNALIPIVTILGLQLGAFLSRAVVTEQVFAWPGIARLTVSAVLTRDFPLIQGTVLWLAVVFIASNLLVDLLYSTLDPRLRYA